MTLNFEFLRKNSTMILALAFLDNFGVKNKFVTSHNFVEKTAEVTFQVGNDRKYHLELFF